MIILINILLIINILDGETSKKLNFNVQKLFIPISSFDVHLENFQNLVVEFRKTMTFLT